MVANTYTVRDASNNAVVVQELPALGSAFSNNSLPVTLANDCVVTITTNTALSVNVSNTIQANVLNFPATQTITGNVSVTGNVNVVGTFWQNTQPVSITNTVSVSFANTSTLPVNVSNATVLFTDTNNSALSASNTYTGVTRSSNLGSTKFNAVFYSTASGTYYIQGSADNFATAINVITGALNANTATGYSVPLVFPYYRVLLVNNTAAANVTIVSSFTLT